MKVGEMESARERGLTTLLPPPHLSQMVDECGEIVVARVCGDLIGREAVLSDCVQVTAGSAETAHDLSVAVLGSKMQRSGSVLHVCVNNVAYVQGN